MTDDEVREVGRRLGARFEIVDDEAQLAATLPGRARSYREVQALQAVAGEDDTVQVVLAVRVRCDWCGELDLPGDGPWLADDAEEWLMRHTGEQHGLRMGAGKQQPALDVDLGVW